MVENQITRRGVRDENVLRAMRRVPRERFVPADLLAHAYEDSPLPIGEGQTISQPYIVAVMLEAAAIAPGDSVLEVGAGSGYAAAVISLMAATVRAIERHGGLARSAAQRLHVLGYRNIEVREGDGTRGWPEAAPFDAIVVAAGGPDVPPALKSQLAIGGRLIMPVGDADRQRLVKVTRRGEDAYDEVGLGTVSFVPLIGEQGWDGDGRRADDDPGAGSPILRPMPARHSPR